MEKAQKLLLQHQCEIVVAFTGNYIAQELNKLFEASQKVLILTNMGENTIVHQLSPYVFDHPMGVCNACWQMGYHMAQNGNRKVLVCSSFYDSGYGLYASFFDGLTAGGGEIVKLFFGLDNLTEASFTEIGQWVKTLKADAVFAIYSGQPASVFLSQYFQNSYLKDVPLYGSPFLLAGETDKKYSYTITSPFDSDGVERPFYVQGTEVAQLLINSIGCINTGEKPSISIEKLKEATFRSQRGTIEVNPDEQITSSPVYLISYSTGEVTNSSLIQHKVPQSFMVHRGASLSGFVNPYLCM